MNNRQLECMLMSPTRATGRARSLRMLNSLLARPSCGLSQAEAEDALVNNMTTQHAESAAVVPQQPAPMAH